MSNTLEVGAIVGAAEITEVMMGRVLGTPTGYGHARIEYIVPATPEGVARYGATPLDGEDKPVVFPDADGEDVVVVLEDQGGRDESEDLPILLFSASQSFMKKSDFLAELALIQAVPSAEAQAETDWLEELLSSSPDGDDVDPDIDAEIESATDFLAALFGPEPTGDDTEE
jgi:hypothetical protein